jgi:peptide/nickel transport system ATP-binding protein
MTTPGQSAAGDSLVKFVGLKRHFDLGASFLDRALSRQKSLVKAVDGIDFALKRGETFGLVGESGCGKSTVARLAVGLLKPTGGEVRFDGRDLNAVPRQELRPLRRRIQMIFQDPYSSMNGRWKARRIIAEPIDWLKVYATRREVDRRVDELLELVGLSAVDGDKYPHEFSGGQRQRIAIARALSTNPDFLVCDEPTSALDVSVQSQILNLMKDLQAEFGLTLLFISHNLAVVSHVANRVGVMYLGRMVEMADSATLFSAPRHPYTRLLLETVPDLKKIGRAREPMAGEVPSPIDPPSGCAFHPRCPLANDRCKRERPELIDASGRGAVACHAVEEGRSGSPLPEGEVGA